MILDLNFDTLAADKFTAMSINNYITKVEKVAIKRAGAT
jgi:hypothetical protein